MFDLHYDLLTNILIRENDIKELKKEIISIYKNDNISGGIFNLFYMSPKEMKDELYIALEDIDIIKNLQKVNYLIRQNNLIPNEVNYIYGIEGLDYLKRIDDIDKLYELGVRSVNIVWNNRNKFAGGAKAGKSFGLTTLGKALVEKLVKTKIAIDLSHTNDKSFFDIIDECEKYKEYKPILFASHSNCRSICKNPRNLTDEQILKIKEIDGIIGVVEIRKFCLNEEIISEEKYKDSYINHIKHIENINGNIDNIAVATDDMEYYRINPNYYNRQNIFGQKTIKKDLVNLLLENKYNKNEINMMLEGNFMNKILQRLQKCDTI